MAPRYVVPSAHLTVARFIGTRDFDTNGRSDPVKISALWDVVEDINVELKRKFDAREGGDDKGADWIVDEMECRYGTQWYGGGQAWSMH